MEIKNIRDEELLVVLEDTIELTGTGYDFLTKEYMREIKVGANCHPLIMVHSLETSLSSEYLLKVAMEQIKFIEILLDFAVEVEDAAYIEILFNATRKIFPWFRRFEEFTKRYCSILLNYYASDKQYEYAYDWFKQGLQLANFCFDEAKESDKMRESVVKGIASIIAMCAKTKEASLPMSYLMNKCCEIIMKASGKSRIMSGYVDACCGYYEFMLFHHKADELLLADIGKRLEFFERNKDKCEEREYQIGLSELMLQQDVISEKIIR